MTTRDIPECGFIEHPDGSIEWGSTWEPGSYHPEPVAVEYSQADSGAWVPRQAWVKDGRGDIDMHDCDWVESRGQLFHHAVGGGDPYINGWSEPERLPGRLWLAEGTSIWSDGFGSPSRVLSDDDLIAIGVKRIAGPTPAPFEGAIEGRTFYDERSQQRVPDDDGERCSCCDEDFVRQKGDLVVRDEYEVDDDETAGLYQPGDFSWSRGVWVCPLPHNMHADWGDSTVCPKCAAQAVSDFSLRGLLDAWCEDPEAMPDEHREALLDAVRERVDKWIEGYPERRATEVHTWFCKEAAPRFGVSGREMQALCDEAGYP